MTASGAPSIDTRQLWKPLGENLARTRFICAKETTHHSQKLEDFSATGYIGKRARVVAVDALGDLLTQRAPGFESIYCERPFQQVWCDIDLFNAQAHGQIQ